jgi:hypothetical protein
MLAWWMTGFWCGCAAMCLVRWWFDRRETRRQRRSGQDFLRGIGLPEDKT